MTTPPDPIPGARLLFTVDPAIAYLDHGAFGAVPLPVQRAQQRLREEMESNPVRFFTASLPDRIAHARRHVASFLGADPDGTGFVPNASAGVSIVLRAIGFTAGDEILTTDHGYGAVALAIAQICAQTGATHRVVPIALTASDDEIVAAISAAITPGRTRLVIIDHIASPTARVMPVARITAAARSRNVPVLVDGAHAPGAHPLPIATIGADFWVGNLHKWLYAPRPAALLCVAEDWRPRIQPLVASWELNAGFPGSIEFQGTLDYTPWLAAPTGLFTFRQLGADRVRAYNSNLVAYGQRVIGAALGLLDQSDLPQPGFPGAHMRVLPLPPSLPATRESAIKLRARLSDELGVLAAINVWSGRMLLRIGAQVYNVSGDYDRLAAGLPGVLRSL